MDQGRLGVALEDQEPPGEQLAVVGRAGGQADQLVEFLGAGRRRGELGRGSRAAAGHQGQGLGRGPGDLDGLAEGRGGGNCRLHGDLVAGVRPTYMPGNRRRVGVFRT